MHAEHSLDIVCLVALVVATLMFGMVFRIVARPAPEEAAMLRAKYRTIIMILRYNRGSTIQLCWAFILALALVLKGTGKAVFVGGGVALASAAVFAGCPGLLPTILDIAYKVSTRALP